MRFGRAAIICVAVAIGLGANTTPHVEIVALKAMINGLQEVPSNNSLGVGVAVLTYDTARKELTWAIAYEGLSGPATAAHFHGPAEPSKNAGVALLMAPDLISPLKGTAILTDAQAAQLTDGRWYVNIHTDAYKAGEIRGQITQQRVSSIQ
jgi:hypothetical protein